MTLLKQSTATDVELGCFVSDSDFKTTQTGLTLVQADCQLIKNGGAAAQKNDATSATHRGGGHYSIPLNATDTATLGRLRVYINKTTALPVWRDFTVVPANVHDSLVGLHALDTLDVNVSEWTGTAVATPDTNGYPKCTIKNGAGAGEIVLTSGRVNADVTHIATAAVATGTAQLGVNAVQVGGAVVASGSIPNAVAGGAGGLPTATAGNQVGVNWANVGSPTTAVALSGTTISTTQAVASCAAATVSAINANVITAASIATDAIDNDALATSAVTEIATAILATPANKLVTDATGQVTVGAIAANAITAASIATGAIDADAIADGAIDAGAIAPAAIDNATFAADVGSTAYATNIIALAADKAIVNTISGRIPAALVGGRIDADVGAVSTSTTAANNMELAYNGTGYGYTGCTMPTVTTLTTWNGIALKKNTEFQNFMFVMRDVTNHAPATGKTVAAYRTIGNGAEGACTNTPATEVASGIYRITLSAADLNGDSIMFRFNTADVSCDDLFLHVKTQS